MQIKYYVPFTAADNVDAQLAIKERLLPIEGTAIDTSVNANKWQVPSEDLDYFVSSLQGNQLRIDHAESAMAVIGKVPVAKRIGDSVYFRAEIGDLPIIEKVLRGYLSHVSVQVDSDDVECSQCHEQTRKEGILVHLCPGAWEIVHKPRVRELSIVASPAYKNTEFKPLGFAAAMNASQNYTAHGISFDERKWMLLHRLQHAQKNLMGQKLQELDEKITELRAFDEEQLNARRLSGMLAILKLNMCVQVLKNAEARRSQPWAFDLEDALGLRRSGIRGFGGGD